MKGSIGNNRLSLSRKDRHSIDIIPSSSPELVPVPFSLDGALLLSSIYAMTPDWQLGTELIDATGGSASDVNIYGNENSPYELDWASITPAVGSSPYANRWLDQSGNGRHFTGNNSLNIASEKIDFNGTSNSLTTSNVDISSLNKIVIVFVGNPNATTFKPLFGNTNVHNGADVIGFGVHPSIGVYGVITAPAYASDRTRRITTNLTDRAVYSLTFDLATDTLTTYRNGSTAGWSDWSNTGSFSTIQVTAKPFVLGQNTTNLSTYMVGVFDGDANPDAMTAQWHQDLSDWWTARWAE